MIKRQQEQVCSKCGNKLSKFDKDDIVSIPLICGNCVRKEDKKNG